MKLKMSRLVLLDEISKANKIIDAKIINPELLGVHLEITNDAIIFLSSNGGVNWKATINKKTDPFLEIQEVGTLLIKGRYLIEVLRKIEENLVELSVVEENQLVIKTDKVRFSLQILNADDYPLIGFRENGVELKLNPSELRKGINQTIISIDEYNKKIIFTGMNLQGVSGDNFLKIFTTDGFRISTKNISLTTPLTEDVEFTLSFKLLGELIRLLDGCKELVIYLFEGYITFVFNQNSLLQTTLIEGKYPNVANAFPKSFPTTLKLGRTTFLKALNRANLTNEEGNTPVVVLDIDQERIELSSTSLEIGNYAETLTNFEFEGEPQKISFNIKYLLDAFRTFDHEEVVVGLISSVKPLEISSLKDEGIDTTLKQLVLPLSIG
ncbi:Beta sliding clamp [Mesoplasma sp. JKS002658]|uniref:DNA polymerase III subunit beta n=1 Tax=Mesoplasma whartonense TaxID=2878854 RepID=UPI002022A8D1|nr:MULTISPECIES: DNA polymerase III subunit beta [unclassified Mesoplasma]MCL8211630.1 Beta sliding clamp [Mesoplasma sp. JKS002664]MCL8212369.1 Beta sliding clamp [Mesoplasma sp. JKS002662]MCL8213517.1 Beta sliding clamp [Mesoplasma sp. JKS002660]MCL8214386.1 Beta sliding clamp [Mesoplasma sp. JKS002658]MCL8214967.1 Beta sliding clamp [Mesoplasma sp. JKS002663]